MRREDKKAMIVIVILVILLIVIVATKTMADVRFDTIEEHEYNENMATEANMILLSIDELGYYFGAEDDEDIGIFIPHSQEIKFGLTNAKEGSLAWVKHIDKYAIDIELE